MKKNTILYAFYLLTISLPSFAQMKKGNAYLGGQFGLSLSTQSGSKPSYTILPGMGFMITDKLSFDFALGYSKSTQSSLSSSYSSYYDVKTFTVGTGLTYYFKLSEQFAFTTGGSVAYAHNSYNSNSYNSAIPFYNSYDYYSNNLVFNVAPGAVYFPHKSFSISAALGSFVNINYNTDAKVAQVQFFNITTVAPKIGVNFWF